MVIQIHMYTYERGECILRANNERIWLLRQVGIKLGVRIHEQHIYNSYTNVAVYSYIQISWASGRCHAGVHECRSASSVGRASVELKSPGRPGVTSTKDMDPWV